jgi:hypothetical protein
MVFKQSQTSFLALVSALTGLGVLFAGVCHGQIGTEAGAVAALGGGDTAVLRLVRELTAWKARAESAEGLLLKAGIQTPSAEMAHRHEQARVLGCLESERVVVLSAGRLSGAVLGSLVSVGDGVVAKVVESRETVAAAIVDQNYQGRVGALDGSLVRILVVKP